MKNKIKETTCKYFRKRTPEQITILLATAITMFGIAFSVLLINSLKNGDDSFTIEHIDSVPIVFPNDTIILKSNRDGKG
mgnify:CR=1 FL=1